MYLMSVMHFINVMYLMSLMHFILSFKNHVFNALYAFYFEF